MKKRRKHKRAKVTSSAQRARQAKVAYAKLSKWIAKADQYLRRIGEVHAKAVDRLTATFVAVEDLAASSPGSSITSASNALQGLQYSLSKIRTIKPPALPKSGRR